MTRALIKKQLMEIFSRFYRGRRSSGLRRAVGILGYALLYLMLLGGLGGMFAISALTLCEPLLSMELGWLYWCLMGLMAVLIGVFGSVFSTYSSLYQARDNDILLSMPVPVSRILLVRLFGVYAVGLLYELTVMIPAAAVWLLAVPFDLGAAVRIPLLTLLLSGLILVLSAALGWCVAQINVRVRHKNILTIAASLTFIAVYYAAYTRAYAALESIPAHAEQVGDRLRGWLYPLYRMGLAAEGDVLSLLLFAVWVAALLAVGWAVLSRSFLRLATAGPGAVRRPYREGTAKARSADSALLRREVLRFVGSANYMLNCGLGILMMPVSAFLMVWKADALRALFQTLPQEALPLLAILLVCATTTMNDIAAPSVSLEGRSLWIARSLPVTGRQVLAAKLKLHLLLTLLPAVAPVIAAEWLFRLALPYAVALPMAVVLFVVLVAASGLSLDLKMANLQWSSEIVPIKQSVPVLLSLFGSWALLVALAGLYLLLRRYVGEMGYLLCVLALLAAADAALLRWLMTRGAGAFAAL